MKVDHIACIKTSIALAAGLICLCCRADISVALSTWREGQLIVSTSLEDLNRAPRRRPACFRFMFRTCTSGAVRRKRAEPPGQTQKGLHACLATSSDDVPYRSVCSLALKTAAKERSVSNATWLPLRAARVATEQARPLTSQDISGVYA